MGSSVAEAGVVEETLAVEVDVAGVIFALWTEAQLLVFRDEQGL